MRSSGLSRYAIIVIIWLILFVACTETEPAPSIIDTGDVSSEQEQAMVVAYDLGNTTRLYVANLIKLYSIGDRTPGFEPNADGSLTIYLQHESPGPEKESNWLPAPDGASLLQACLYWPEQEALNPLYAPPPGAESIMTTGTWFYQ